MSPDTKPNLVSTANFEQPEILVEQVARQAPLYAVFDSRKNRIVTISTEINPPNIQDQFDRLVEDWDNETAHLSVDSQRVTNMNFFRIISLGRAVLPFILNQFKQEPDSAWIVALEAIAGEDPAKKAKSYDETVKIWLAWGQQNGITG